MAEYFRILYVNTRSPGNVSRLPDEVKNIRDWTWGRSALVRWSCIDLDKLSNALDTADLVIFDWSSKNADVAEEVRQQIRTRRPDLPILVIESYPGQTPMRDVFLTGDAGSVLVKDPTDPAQIASGFDSLKLTLPPARLNVHPDPNNLAASVLIGWAGPERLPLLIQKYFPDAKDAYIMPVGGGWSDAKLCRLFVDSDENEYFFKFFPDREVYKSELLHHAEARQWLGDATVDLKLIPDIAGEIINQDEAFQDISPPRFPICYESASTRHHRRETYKELYRNQTDSFIEGVLNRLLAILARNQPDAEVFQSPWSDTTAIGFCLTPTLKMHILDTIQDLAMYGPQMCSERKWNQIAERIQRLVYQPITKLYTPWPVTVGHIHGDPNPRNCLVNPTNENDMLLIDCGGYLPDGRLVSDLALIERDIKLVLMGTEIGAGGFFDLEVTELPEWCRFESDSISRGLEYKSSYAPTSSASSRRAYRLVGYIRERAKQISGTRDMAGRHYFAALLFWTLDILKYPAVRPTKKLFALYSAAEIIGQFI